jgi:hypothetical protein
MRALLIKLASLGCLATACGTQITGDLAKDLSDGLLKDERRVFISHQVLGGNIKVVYGSLDGACATFASQGGLKRTYRPIISDSVASAVERVGTRGPIYILNRLGEKALVTEDPSTLWSGSPRINTRILRDQYGDLVDSSSRTWTGSASDGTHDSGKTCSDWTSTAAEGFVGDPDALDLAWIRTGFTFNCTDNSIRRLYCISD